jgi:hypothetical protein
MNFKSSEVSNRKFPNKKRMLHGINKYFLYIDNASCLRLKNGIKAKTR